jgi:hypothetical protein
MKREEILKIKQDMTQGEFGPVNRFAENKPYNERIANNIARTLAVNNTLVIGINPLSVVQMQEALLCCQQYFNRNKITSPLVDMVDKALQNSKI